MSQTILQNQFNSNVTVIGSARRKLHEALVSKTNTIAQQPGVDQIVLLPDVHLKKKYLKATYQIHVPSSAVISTEVDSFYPQFRSRGVGCGMMLIATGLMIDQLPKEMSNLLSVLPLYLTSTRPVYQKGWQGRQSFVMSKSEMIQMCLGGAPWMCQELGMPVESIENFWSNTNFLSESEIREFSWHGFNKRAREGQFRNSSQIGWDLSGNHFLEAQCVQETPSTSDGQWLKKGELLFLYHGSCNGLQSILEPELVNRIIKQPTFKRLTPNDSEYELVFRATKVLLNWSAAARVIVFARLRCLLNSRFPELSLDNFRCVSEAPHNMISVESVNGEDRIIYRHNAVPIKPTQPVIVSGRYDHPSYLFLPGKEPQRSLNTLDHGIGSILADDSQQDNQLMSLSSWRIEQHYLTRQRLWKRYQLAQMINPVVTEPLFRDIYEQENLIQNEAYTMYPLASIRRKGIGAKVFQKIKGLME